MKKGAQLSKAKVAAFMKREAGYLLYDILGAIVYAMGIYTFTAHVHSYALCIG